MSRTSFTLPESSIVVSTEGYFDVYPTGERSNGDRPAYRGGLSELGTGIRGIDDRLAVRPSSTALSTAVTTWSSEHGESAVRGDLGKGRDGNQVAG